MLDLGIYIVWACQLFILGLVGMLALQSNILFALIAIEMMLLSTGIILAVASNVFLDGSIQGFVLIILTVAASEAAIGLALLIRFYKLCGDALYGNEAFIK
jgi:NADH-quinone oxidoreductase subunit K